MYSIRCFKMWKVGDPSFSIFIFLLPHPWAWVLQLILFWILSMCCNYLPAVYSIPECSLAMILKSLSIPEVLDLWIRFREFLWMQAAIIFSNLFNHYLESQLFRLLDFGIWFLFVQINLFNNLKLEIDTFFLLYYFWNFLVMEEIPQA